MLSHHKLISFLGISIVLIVSAVGLAQVKEPAPAPVPTQPQSVAKLEGIVSDTDIVAYLLNTKGLTRETARLDPQTLDTLAAQQVMVQPHFVRYWKNPYEFPKFCFDLVKAQEKNISDTAKGVFEQFGISQLRTGHRAAYRYEYVPELEPKKDMPVQEALLELAKKCDAIITEENRVAIANALKDVPPELQAYIAKLILGAREAKFYRDRAVRNYPKERLQHAFDCAVLGFATKEDTDEEFNDMDVVNWDLGQALDYDDLYTGAGLNLKAICELEAFLDKPAKAVTTEGVATPTMVAVNISNLAFEIDTPLGKVVFNSKDEENTYQCENYLAIIDLYGNDTYKGPAAASYKLEHPISTIIDWSGNDTYAADKDTPCSQGAGILGYGFLLDNSGDDTFTAVNNAQGMCYFGVGLLWDRGGDDSFKAHTSAQGSASFGVANLVKLGGNDSYYAYYTSQGFGFVGGYGALIDTGGNDKYVAEPYDLIHPGKLGHDNLRNYNFCQGAGWGQRGDIFGGHSMAGGTGVLQDFNGDDTYECGVYGQATSYWYSTGILYDKSGNDKYEGSFWVQGSTPHMGLSMFIDEAGSDSYHVWHAISQGGAHDFAVAFFLDRGGDNKFSAWEWKDKDGKQTLDNTGVKGSGGGVLLGSAINNSIGVFMSIGGNNTYEYYTNSSFGFSNQGMSPDSWRYGCNNIGLFIEIGGKPTYNTTVEKDTPANYGTPAMNSIWSRMPEKAGNQAKNFSFAINTPVGRVPEAERQ